MDPDGPVAGAGRTTAPLLAIECGQRPAGIALRDAVGSVHERPTPTGRGGGDRLMAEIDALLSSRGLGPVDLGGLAVSIGPGGFTGLRIAIATAKILGRVLGLPIAAVPTAIAVAAADERDGPAGADEVHDRGGRLLVLLAGKRTTAWATRLRRDPAAPAGWAVEGRPGLVDDATVELAGVERVLGDEHVPPAIRERCLAGGLEPRRPVFGPPGCLLAGERLLAAGGATTPEALAPIYPREPEAVSLFEQRRRAESSRGG